jgi:hypothetical protein
VATARTEGLAGAFGALQSNAQTLGVTLGRVLSGPIAETAKNFAIIFAVIDKGIGKLGELNAQIPGKGEGFFGGLSDDINEFGKSVAIPGAALINVLKVTGALDAMGFGATETQKRIKELNDQLQVLQDVRVLAEKGAAGPSVIAKDLNAEIKELRKQIAALESEGKRGIGGGITDQLEQAVVQLEKLRSSQGPNVDTSGIDRMISKLKDQIVVSRETDRENARLTRTIGFLGSSATASASGVDTLAKSLRSLKAASTAASSELLRLQNEGAGPQAEIANLQGQRQNQEDIIAAIKSNGNQPGDATKIDAARTEINRIQSEIDGLLAGIKSDAEAAARDAKEKADDIAQAQEDATRAFIEGFGGKKQKILNQIAAAGLTERLSDDIKFQAILVDFLRKLVQAIQNRIKKLKLTGDALKAAQAAIKTINQEINNTLLDIQKDQQDAIERTQDIINQKLDIKIQIAQAQDNTAAEIRARKAKLAQITKELVAAKKEFGKNSLAWLELKAAQAEQIAAIKELENQTKKDTGKSAQQFFFEQLQAQQGFASNLLGNLIPRDQTAGLVGTPSPSTPGGGISLAASVQEGKSTAGVTSGQVSTTNAILHRILKQLEHLNGVDSTPEAKYQRGQGAAIMDGGGGNIVAM